MSKKQLVFKYITHEQNDNLNRRKENTHFTCTYAPNWLSMSLKQIDDPPTD